MTVLYTTRLSRESTMSRGRYLTAKSEHGSHHSFHHWPLLSGRTMVPPKEMSQNQLSSPPATARGMNLSIQAAECRLSTSRSLCSIPVCGNDLAGSDMADHDACCQRATPFPRQYMVNEVFGESKRWKSKRWRVWAMRLVMEASKVGQFWKPSESS